MPPTATLSKAPLHQELTEASVSRAGNKDTGRIHAQSCIQQRDKTLDQGCKHLPPSAIQGKEQESNKFEVKYDFIINSDERSDYEQGSITKFRKGSLRENLSYWREIEASDFLLDIIENGYKLPFVAIPKQHEFKNNKSAIIHSDFVTSSILELIDSHRIVELHSKPHVINPLSVSANKDKKRLILDLRYVNRHLERQKVRFEDWKVFQNYLTNNGFLFKFDLKSGYHHVEINRDYQSYLGFSWKFKDNVRYFAFSVLPFGLSTAPFIFTKVCRPLVKLWRFSGVKIVLYLDDGFSISKSFADCLSNANFVKDSLLKAGFIPNQEKSVWQPTNTCDWLGIVLDTKEGSLCIPEGRILSLLSSLKEVQKTFPLASPRKLCSIAGKILSMSFVVGNVSKLMTKGIFAAIESRMCWDTLLDISRFPRACNELKFWCENIRKLNRRLIFRQEPPKLITFSDASSVACGAVLLSCGNQIAHKTWNAEEKSMSSTWRELKAVDYALQSFLPILKFRSVHWFTDNKNVVSIINNGSMKTHLQKLAFDIFSSCLRNNISLFPERVPREYNTHADFVSKVIDYDDWQTTKCFFDKISQRWGPFTVDRFASSTNAKCPRFNSLLWNPGSEQVNAFSVSWAGENNWLVPPIFLISKAILHLLSCKAKGVIVAPCWPSAPFWPLLFVNKFVTRSYVTGVMYFDNPTGIFELGNYKGSLLGSDKYTSPVLAVTLDGSTN